MAVRTVLDAYHTGADAQARLSVLSTYLGHVNPSNTLVPVGRPGTARARGRTTPTTSRSARRPDMTALAPTLQTFLGPRASTEWPSRAHRSFAQRGLVWSTSSSPTTKRLCGRSDATPRCAVRSACLTQRYSPAAASVTGIGLCEFAASTRAKSSGRQKCPNCLLASAGSKAPTSVRPPRRPHCRSSGLSTSEAGRASACGLRSAQACGLEASPRKTISDRFSCRSSSSRRRPSRSLRPDLGTVVILSTTRLLGRSSPFSCEGWIWILTSGASIALVVNGQTETDAVASNRSSWTITTGRGLPV